MASRDADRPIKSGDEQIKLRIKLEDGRLWEIMTGNYVSIDPKDVNEGLIDQSNKVAWINSVYIGAKLERNRIKRALDKLEGKLREKAIADIGDEKKPTEKAIDAWITKQPEYEAMWEKVERADWELGQINAVREGLRDRRDMLVAVNLNDRREREQDLGKTVAHEKARELDREYRDRLKDRSQERRDDRRR
jgi:hypothetical protein